MMLDELLGLGGRGRLSALTEVRDLVGDIMVAKFDRGSSMDHMMRMANRKYLDAPPKVIHQSFADQLATYSTIIQESILYCLDKGVMAAMGANNSPSQALHGKLQDIEDGWAKIVVDEDTFNVEIKFWNGAEFISGDEQDVDAVLRRIARYKAEVGEDEDGASVSDKVLWAVLKHYPFESMDDIVERGRNGRVDFYSVSNDIALAVAEECGFELHAEEDKSSCWRSRFRESTRDDVCLLIPKAGGLSLVSSQSVKGIDDATTPETCTCYRCVTRREHDAKQETDQETDVEDSEDDQPLEQAAEASTSEGD